MVNITVLCVGKLKESFFLDACAEYVKRLQRYCKLSVVELKEERLPDAPSPAEIDAALAREAERIRAKLPPSASVVALCIEGRLRSSEELSGLIQTWSHNSAKHLVFVVGGSFGLHASIKNSAWAQLSMSPMTFPHHLARVMLLEQLYRAFQIAEGSKYHK